VNNAIKHGQAKNIVISLSAGKEYGRLTIENDGLGMPESTNGPGMGMQIMNYRARMIGGSLRVESGGSRGVVISCIFPVPRTTRRIEGLHDHKTAQ
jgi:signal transduction histidine kinase